MGDRIGKAYFKTYILMSLAALGIYGLVSPVSTRSFAQSSVASTIEGADFYAPDVISVFYQQQSMKPLWLRGQTSFQPRAEAILRLLDASWTHGLNPDNYHVKRLHELMTGNVDVNQTELDMLLSDAVVRYARDMTGMRGKERAEEDVRFWRQSMAPEEILQQVALDADPVKKLKALEPAGNLYQKLRQELVALSGNPDSMIEPILIKGLLKPGKAHPEVIKLRNRFNSSEEANSESTTYDEALAANVMAFQRSYGLKADGIIGPATLEFLNKTDEDKKLQIIANLERLRWMDQSRPDRYILVNIPSASLWAVEDGAVALEMPVIVGKTARPTYSFKTNITGVRFNPNWTVPPTIKKTDFLPMLRADPSALTRKGIRLVSNGQDIDPGSLDWKNMSSGELARLKMVQNPGDDNPLGKVRVIMENPYDIYLHDTNHRDLFAGTERALSSGCIRVSQPDKLASFILKRNDGWNERKTESVIAAGKMRDIKTAQNLPVYITYQTIWLDSQGTLVYGRDFYGQDKKLTNLIKQKNGIHFPQLIDNEQISL